MMNDIVKIAQNLRKEHLFVNEQKQHIKGLNEKISNSCDRIFHTSWTLRQQRQTLYEHIYSRKDVNLESSTCDKANSIEQASFIDSYKVLNNESHITELLTYIRKNPDLMAECLLKETDKQTCEQSAQILIAAVYGNAILHEDYMLTVRLLKNLIDKQLAISEDPRKVLRQTTSTFSSLFKTFTEGLLEAKLFLNSTLNDSILHVLGEDEIMLEIDPDKAAMRFAAHERTQRQPASPSSSNGSSRQNSALSSAMSSSNRQAGNINDFKQLNELSNNTKLYKTYVTNRLVSFTAKFIEGIRDSIHCLPPSLLWIIKYVYDKLLNDARFNDCQVRTVCSDLLFNSFICPAILYPDYYGVTDAYISPNGRFNLAQVAQIIQVLAVSNYERGCDINLAPPDLPPPILDPLIVIDNATKTASSDANTQTASGTNSQISSVPNLSATIAPKLSDIYSFFPPDCVSSILDYVLNNTCDIDQVVDSVANCKDVSRTCFLITESEISLLISFLQSVIPKLESQKQDTKEVLTEILKNALASLKSNDKLKKSDGSTSINNSGSTSSLSGTNAANNPNGSPRSRRNNMLKRVARKGFKSSSSSSDILNTNSSNSNTNGANKTEENQSYQVLMVPFINRSTTNYITTILPEENADQEQIIDNSEVASVNSVASSSLELENENDNLSDMVSAHVSSGRATPNVSGRNTPSQGSVDNHEHVEGIINGPLVDFSSDMPDVIQKDTSTSIVPSVIQPLPANPAIQSAEIQIEDKFCKFNVRQDIGIDETKSLLSDTWSTDVMANDCDFIPYLDGEHSNLSYTVARLNLLNLRVGDPNEPILRAQWPISEPLISFADTATITDIKKKLRLVFGSVDLLYIPQPATMSVDSPNDNELVKYLKVLLSNTSRLDSSDSVAVKEAIRCVKPFSNSACSELLRSVLDDYERRTNYMQELVEFHQRLLIVSFRFQNVLNHVERDKLICNHNLVTLYVGKFMEQKERSLQFLIRKFQTINAADEKTRFVEKFLNVMYTALESDNSWSRATPEQLDHARRIIERHVMTQIYWSAFYPNGEADVHRDKVLSEHMKKLSKIINLDHKDLKIPEAYHSESPWPSAQAEIEVINSCKAARDKVSCVVNCCKNIMALLSLADEKRVPSADDLMPVLVFVLIRANPNSLLSTVQYVNSFYEKQFQGEQAYWWAQFCCAIEFIKTMDYWETEM